MTKFYTDDHTDLLYTLTEYITYYFRSDVIVKKIVEDATSDGFWWNFSRTV